jgi:hypothetical protein
MKKAVLWTLIIVGIVIVVVGQIDQSRDVFAQRSATNAVIGGGGNLLAVPTALGDKGQLLTVIDPQQQAIGVYYIELPSGKIKLLSVRNIRWDMQMTYMNNENPLPQEIRTLLEQR